MKEMRTNSQRGWESKADRRPCLSPWICGRLELHQDALGVVEVEHRQAPHLPVGVARMRVVGELQSPRPAVLGAVLDLGEDLSRR